MKKVLSILLSAVLLIGMLLIFVGCMILPQKSFRNLFDWNNYKNSGLLRQNAGWFS